VNLGAPTIVVQQVGEDFGLTQVLERTANFTELTQHWPQIEADLEGLLQRGPAFRQRREGAERLLEPAQGLLER
jgi:hypothetical protein